MNHKAQGSLEYLLLLAAAIMIASVVVVTMTGTTGNTKTAVDVKISEFMQCIGIQCGLSVSCSNNGPKELSPSGSASIILSSTPSGGKAPYAFSWSGNCVPTKRSSQNPLITCYDAGNYSYTVTVTDSSSPAEQKSCTTNVIVKMPVPEGLAATAGNAQVSLSWNSVSGATKYKLEVTGGKTATIDNITLTSYTDAGLTNGTQYNYRAAACNSSVCSEYSNSVSATPSAPTLSRITIRKGSASAIDPLSCYSSPRGTEVNNTTQTLSPGTTEFYCAYAVYSDGTYQNINRDYKNSTTDNSLRWSSTGDAGSISATPPAYGTFTATSPQPTTTKTSTITYTYKLSQSESATANFNVQVLGTGGVDCAVSPSTATVSAGGTQQFTLSGSTSWSSSNTSIATINSSGLATGVSAGSATITATKPSCSQNPTASLTVTAGAGGTGATGVGRGTCVASGAYTMCVQANQGGQSCVTAGNYTMCIEINKGGENCVTLGSYSLCMKANQG